METSSTTLKFIDFLLEFKERLNRLSTYGAWIDTNTNKIYDMHDEGDHVEFVKTQLHNWGISPEYIHSTDDYYTAAFANGFVRVNYQFRSTVIFDGMAKDIKKIAPIIMATAVQPDVNSVGINKIRHLGEVNTNMKFFSLPEQRKELQAFIGT